MNDLSAFGKSLQTSLSAAGAELSSVASSTGTELLNFGREIARRLNETSQLLFEHSLVEAERDARVAGRLGRALA